MTLKTLNTFAGCTSAVPAADMLFKNVPIVIDDDTNREATLPVTCLYAGREAVHIRHSRVRPGDRRRDWRGGMGVVYCGRDPKFGRDVAINVRPDAMAQDPERLARFECEAKHPTSSSSTRARKATGVRGTAFSDVFGPTLAAGRAHRRARAVSATLLDGADAARFAAGARERRRAASS
jgi:hypothetical protein